MVVGTADITWLRHILGELHEPIISSTLLCDNQSAINIALNHILYFCTKHIEIDQHFVCQKIKNKELNPAYIRTDDQVADMFNKGLTRPHY